MNDMLDVWIRDLDPNKIGDSEMRKIKENPTPYLEQYNDVDLPHMEATGVVGMLNYNHQVR